MDRLVQPLLGPLLEQADLVGAGLEQHADPVGVVVHGEVGQPGAGVGVHHDLVAAVDVDDDVLTGHGVLVVVLVVLVKDGRDLLAWINIQQLSPIPFLLLENSINPTFFTTSKFQTKILGFLEERIIIFMLLRFLEHTYIYFKKIIRQSCIFAKLK